jgi:hypothetical protein
MTAFHMLRAAALDDANRRAKTLEKKEPKPMPHGSTWRVVKVCTFGLAPDESVLGQTLIVSHVEPDGRVWLRNYDGIAACNKPGWWQAFVEPAERGKPLHGYNIDSVVDALHQFYNAAEQYTRAKDSLELELEHEHKRKQR